MEGRSLRANTDTAKAGEAVPKSFDSENTLLRAISQFQSELTEAWNETKPIIKLFATKTNHYFYDTGTNRIFSCTPFEYEFLKNLVSLPIQDALDMRQYSCTPSDFIAVLQHINDLMKEKGILKATSILLRAPSHIHKLVHSSLSQIILETTERCNLRCRYCIYNPSFSQKRNHGNRDMSLDVAYRAIDHLANSSGLRERVAISFYGGEPLLRFPFIRECVKYAKAKIPKEKLAFSTTTNGTLITRETANYFAENGFGVHVSIDGPKDIHDENRIYPNKRGSFSRVKRGMTYLLDAFGEENKNRISISMVYSPPYSEDKITRIAALWDEPWLPKDIIFSFSYCQRDIPPAQMNFRGVDHSVLNWTIKNYIEAFRLGIRPHPLAAQFLEKKLALIHQRFIFDREIQETGLNACCVPAVRKIFFSVDGTMYLCERVGSAPDIGNVRSGLDIEKVKRVFLSEYRDQSEAQCSRCWCSRLCDICYVQSYYDGAFDARYKKDHCELQKNINEIYLMLYCRLLEINPGGIDYLFDMKIT